MEAKYTVFFYLGSFLASGNGDKHGLQELIDWGTDERDHAIAWAAEPTSSYGGTKSMEELRAESIAAGRLIDCINGKYIPRGAPVEEKKEAQFCEKLAADAADDRAWFDAMEAGCNAAMIARDGPALKARITPFTNAVTKPTAPVSTALPANPALTRMAGASHLFGSSWR